MISLIGQVVTAKGMVGQIGASGEPEPYTLRANAYLKDQAFDLPICVNHDSTFVVGTCGHLERSKVGLMMVGRLERDDMADMLEYGPWFLSDSVQCRRMGVLTYGQGRLNEFSLVRRTANLCTDPVRWAIGDISTSSCGRPSGLPLYWHDTWQRAAEAMGKLRYRAAPDHLSIVDVDPLDIVDEILTDPVKHRAALAQVTAKRSAPTLRPQPSHLPRVRWYGQWLDPEVSATVLDLLEFG